MAPAIRAALAGSDAAASPAGDSFTPYLGHALLVFDVEETQPLAGWSARPEALIAWGRWGRQSSPVRAAGAAADGPLPH